MIEFLYGVLIGFVGANVLDYIFEVMEKRDKR